MSQAAQLDPFLSDLETVLRPAEPKRCAFATWFDDLDDERAQALGAVVALSPKAVPSTRIYEFAARYGYTAKEGVIQEHRSGRCACVR